METPKHNLKKLKFSHISRPHYFVCEIQHQNLGLYASNSSTSSKVIAILLDDCKNPDKSLNVNESEICPIWLVLLEMM